ncbi:hypothetical protein PVAG01_08467 [Phlyctema vagabunda]|uniref:Uncharacterized protein n=1 Tax=Phlyctema vagabunda TaxID=108571 RepID=A0ABR4P9H4_9HELO
MQLDNGYVITSKILMDHLIPTARQKNKIVAMGDAGAEKRGPEEYVGPRLGSRMYAARSSRKTAEEIGSELRTAVARCEVSQKPAYKKVVVLAIRWEEDEMGVEALEEELLCELKEHWQFIVERHRIALRQGMVTAHLQLIQRCNEIKMKYDRKGNVIIVLYSGYGMPSSGAETYSLSPNLFTYSEGPYGIFDPYQNRFEISSYAAFYRLMSSAPIADMCYILPGCPENPAREYLINVEVLAATGRQDLDGAQLYQSFTRRLIDILKAKRAHGTSLAEIFQRMTTDHLEKRLEAMPVYFPT